MRALVISGGAVTSVTVTTTGSGYSAGDTITVNTPSSASGNLVFTLVTGDIVASERNLLKGDFSSGALELGQTSGTVSVLNDLSLTSDSSIISFGENLPFRVQNCRPGKKKRRIDNIITILFFFFPRSPK